MARSLSISPLYLLPRTFTSWRMTDVRLCRVNCSLLAPKGKQQASTASIGNHVVYDDAYRLAGVLRRASDALGRAGDVLRRAGDALRCAGEMDEPRRGGAAHACACSTAAATCAAPMRGANGFLQLATASWRVTWPSY